MVQPKTIGKTTLAHSKSPSDRRHDLQVVVPIKNEVRRVEAFDATPAEGAQEIITAENSTFKFLRLCRIFLKGENSAHRTLGKEEAIYYVNRGTADLLIDGEHYILAKGDVLYVGIDRTVVISTKDMLDLSEFKAVDCHTVFPVQLVRHTDIEGTELAAHLGTRRPMSERTVYKLVDKNAKEEIYHFRCESDIQGDVPYVLQNCALPEEQINVYAHIFDEVAINVTPTYHDTIAPPSVDFMFTWCLASFTEGHRDWAEIYNKPRFEDEW